MRHAYRYIIATTAVLFGLSVAAPPLLAYDKHDVAELVRMCATPAGTAERSYCVGFISGIADHMALIGSLLSNSDKDVRTELATMAMCAQAPLPTPEQKVDAFKAWAQKHPDQSESPNTLGVITAMRETWSCTQSSENPNKSRRRR